MKLLSKELKLALIAILTVAIIYFGVIFLKGMKLSGTDNIYYAVMDDVDGLSVAAPVRANGVQVGIVKDITFIPERQKVLVKVELDDGISITKGSTVTLSKAVLGAPEMKILLAPNKIGYMSPNDTLQGSSATDLLSSAGELMPQVDIILGKVDTLLSNVNYILENPAINGTLYNVQSLTGNFDTSSRGIPYIIDDFKSVSGNFKTISEKLVNTADHSTDVMDDAKVALENLKNTSASINHICVELEKDLPGMITSFNNVGENLSATTQQLKEAELSQVINNLNGTVSELNNLTNTLNNAMNNPNSSIGKILNEPGVYNSLDSTLQNAALLLEDLKENPKRYVHFSLFGKKSK